MLNPTQGTWNQVANEQSYNLMTSGNLNSKTLITQYDPIYNKLVEQISYTMYRKLEVLQRLRNLGMNAPANAYPGILREIYMLRRKGQDFPGDYGERPTTLGAYDIYNDKIDVRYHSAQFRWMYPYTIFDEELRRFSGGNGVTIAQLAEMKMANAVSARNLFMDMLRKKTMATMAVSASVPVSSGVSFSDTMTQAQARSWLLKLKNILFELENGTSSYSPTGEFVQVPKNRLQMVMRFDNFNHLMTTAFPDTFSETRYFDNILPENLILVNTFGDDIINRTTGETTAEVTPTFNDVGMNLLNWDSKTDVITAEHPKWQAIVFDKDCMGFEDNLDTILFAMKDIEKLATPVRMHFWTKAYFTDLLPSLVISGV